MAPPGAGKPDFLVLRGTRKSGPPLPLFAECNALFLSPPLVFPISFNFFFSNVGARLFESAQNIYAERQISLRRIWRGKLGRPAKRRGRRGVAGGGSAVPKGTAKASHGQLFWASVFCRSIIPVQSIRRAAPILVPGARPGPIFLFED